MMNRWALFISGRGSTAQAAMDLGWAADVALVVSSKESAPGVKRARRMGIPTWIIPSLADGKTLDWTLLQSELEKRQISKIFLLGFMRIVPEAFLAKWVGRVWNVHPSLLPLFQGARALERSLASQEKVGLSIHAVTAELDRGPLCLQMEVPELDVEARKSVDPVMTQVFFSAREQRAVRQWMQIVNLNRQRTSAWL